MWPPPLPDVSTNPHSTPPRRLAARICRAGRCGRTGPGTHRSEASMMGVGPEAAPLPHAVTTDRPASTRARACRTRHLVPDDMTSPLPTCEHPEPDQDSAVENG